MKGRLQEGSSLFYLKTYELAVIAYDTVLSFPQEIKCIWGRKLEIGTILYLFVRYGTIMDMILNVFTGTYVPKTVSVSTITP